MQPLSPYFENFTALPEGPAAGGGGIYYFRVAGAAPAETRTLTLADARPLALLPLTLRVAADPAGTEALVDQVRGRPLPARLLHREATGLRIDLSPWGPGHYQLARHGQELLHCYADAQLHAARAWGVLEIEAPALAAGPLHLQLAFEARRTRWRYLVRYRPGPDGPAPENPAVRAKAAKGQPAATVRFAQVAPVAPADAVFESDEALALAERPGVACTLHFGLHGAPVEMALPAARAEALCRPAAPATDPPGPAFSEILVLL